MIKRKILPKTGPETSLFQKFVSQIEMVVNSLIPAVQEAELHIRMLPPLFKEEKRKVSKSKNNTKPK